ncbi:type II toxin-antitoxin system RelE/ParE family toxin [Gordonia sp. NPDC003504]
MSRNQKSEAPIEWVGSSLADLRDLPLPAKQDLGYQLEQIQFGSDPDNWRPMPGVGAGCREIRVRTTDGAYRAFYVTKLDDYVYVLHVFTKKTQTTTQRDLDTGKRRYAEAREIARHRNPQENQ